MEIPEKILERLQKMIALQKSPGTVGEAAAATAMINQMLLKYNISLADVESKVEATKNGVQSVQGLYSDFQTQYDGAFVHLLMNTITKYNFCKMLNHQTPDAKDFGFTVLGKKTNLDVALYMFDYCLNNIKILFERDYRKNNEHKRGTGKFYVQRRAFYEGAVLAIAEKLELQKKETEKEVQREQDAKREQAQPTVNEITGLLEYPKVEENALMVITKNEQDEIDEVIDEMLNDVGADEEDIEEERNAKGTRDEDNKLNGYLAGQELDFAKGLGKAEEKQSMKLLNY